MKSGPVWPRIVPPEHRVVVLTAQLQSTVEHTCNNGQMSTLPLPPLSSQGQEYARRKARRRGFTTANKDDITS